MTSECYLGVQIISKVYPDLGTDQSSCSENFQLPNLQSRDQLFDTNGPVQVCLLSSILQRMTRA